MVPPRSVRQRAHRSGLFDGCIWPKTGYASIAFNAMACYDFLPLALRGHSSRDNKVAPAPSSADASARGCAGYRLRPVDHHRDRNGAGSKQTGSENYHGNHRHLQEVRQ